LGSFNFTDKCNQLAEKTDTFSGRELSKLIVSCQAAAYSSDDGVLTEKMIDDKLKQALESHEKKIKWRSDEEQL
jgi:ATPase family AAA domain-containing protein 3A/B